MSVCNSLLTNNQTVVDIRRWNFDRDGRSRGPTIVGIQLTEAEFIALSVKTESVHGKIAELNSLGKAANNDPTSGK
ncbi:MAG: hypothetical protein GY696_34775 [Gammaproteobacteria bacterium]|nr:hypothetical protein [Gammaproteobacteria bacterium]